MDTKGGQSDCDKSENCKLLPDFEPRQDEQRYIQ